MAHGSFVELDAGDPNVLAYRRELGSESLLVVVNLSGEVRSIRLGDLLPPEGGQLELVLGNGDASARDALGEWEARVYRLTS